MSRIHYQLQDDGVRLLSFGLVQKRIPMVATSPLRYVMQAIIPWDTRENCPSLKFNLTLILKSQFKFGQGLMNQDLLNQRPVGKVLYDLYIINNNYNKNHHHN